MLFFFVGLVFFALGLIGEYIGRIYLEVRRRPTYLVRAVHGDGATTNGFQPPLVVTLDDPHRTMRQ